MAAAACDTAFADLMFAQAAPTPTPPPPDQPQPLPQQANRRRAAKPPTSTPLSPPLVQNVTVTGSQNTNRVEQNNTDGKNINEVEESEAPPPPLNPAATKTCNCSKRDLEN